MLIEEDSETLDAWEWHVAMRGLVRNRPRRMTALDAILSDELEERAPEEDP